MGKVLKQDLIKENAKLQSRNNELNAEDHRLRKEFSNLLGNYDKIQTGYAVWTNTASSSVMSWEEIFFAMGELKADANYSCLIASREEMRREIEMLKKPKKPLKESPDA